MCKHNWIIRNEEKTCMVQCNYGVMKHIFDQTRECLDCGNIEKRRVLYSHVGIGWTPEFEGVYNG